MADTQAVRVQTRDAHTLAITGALTFATAATAYADGVAALAQASPVTIELSGMTEADSAGLACVLALLALGQRKQPGMRVSEAPQCLRALARVCDASAWIEPSSTER
ncbi:MAG: STAS domain-containing protein [Xanthomonadales bacterium]|nr:STAS domain-containing protein [Xanthomonadales bacterium]